MKCFCDIDYNLLTSVIALIVALVAIYLSFRALRYQIIALINVQLSDKAKECNNNLDINNMSSIPKRNDKFSGILSSIITAEEILNYQLYLKKNIFKRGIDIQSLIDQFYLQLHTTIRVFLQKGEINENDLENNNHLVTFKEQYQRSIDFLADSINKDINKHFEKLHSYSLTKNKKYKKK